MKKRLTILLVSLVLILGNIMNVSASESIPMGEDMMTDEAIAALLKDPDGISPRWQYIMSSTEEMGIDSDGIAFLYGNLIGDPSYVNKVTCYMYLQKRSSANGGFTNIASWRTTVNSFQIDVEKKYQIASTGTYRIYCIYHAFYGPGSNDYEVTSGYGSEMDY